MFQGDVRSAFTRVEDPTPLEHTRGSHLAATSIEGREHRRRFSARLYCGQSARDTRRERIILENSLRADIPRGLEKRDHMGGGHGPQVREEICTSATGLCRAFGNIF